MHSRVNFINKFYKKVRTFAFLILLFNTFSAQSQSGCPNADFSLNSFGNWNGSLGSCCPINLPTPGFLPTRHTLIFNQATDANTGNQLNMIPPNYTRSARLGNDNSGCEAEGLSYSLTVDSSNALFIYSYAVVLYDPGHPTSDQPRFEIEVLDGNGNPVACTYYQVASANNIPGFQNSGSVRWKDWEQVGVDLSPYIGQTISFNVRTGDCGYCGHYGYAYIAAKCYPMLLDISYCIGDTVAVLVAPDGFSNYLWSTGATTKNITINNPATNTDTITVTMTSVSGCVATLSVELEPAVIIPNFTYDAKCNGEIQFTNTSTVNYGYLQGWSWDFGDGDTSNVENPTHTYNSPGTYNVTLNAITNGGCFNDTTITITVPPSVEAGFTVNYDTCGYDITVTDTTNGNNIVGWNWDFGDFTYSTQQNPLKSYFYPGNFTISLIVTYDSICTDTATQQIQINSNPVAMFTTSNVCYGDVVTFNNTSYNPSGVNSWSWDFGDNTTSNLQNPTHTYASPGTYPITLIVAGPGPCSDTMNTNITVNPTPVANFILPNICGLTQTFTDSSTISSGSIVSWLWNFGDGDTSTQQNPTHTYAQQGLYNVQLIVTSDSGCVDTLTLLNNAIDKPIAAFTTNDICLNEIAAFNNISIANYQITSWLWDFGDNTTSTLQDPTHQYLSPGNYTVTLIAGNNQCSDTTTSTITVYPSPIANFTVSTNCGLNKSFFDISTTSLGNIISWNWDFGDNTTSTQQNPTHTYSQFGTYNVQLIVTTNNGCIDTITTPLTINIPPVSGFTNTSACEGNIMSFTDTTTSNIPLTNWFWDFGDNTTSTLQNPTHTYTTAGTYNVMLVASYGQCTDTVYQNVVVQPKPIANFVLPTQCGFTQSFTDNSSITSGSVTGWYWNFGDNSTSTQQNPTHTYTQSGAYQITLVAVSDSGCTDTIVQTLNVYSIPTAAFTASNVCDGQTVTFTDNSTNNNDPINTWSWDFGDNTTSIQQNPTHTYNAPGTYTVQLIVSGPGNCSDTITNTVTVYPKPVAGITLPDSCGFSFNFTDNSSISTGNINGWNWDFGDNTTSNQQNPTHTYSNYGTWNIQLIVTSNFGCTDTAIVQFTNLEIPNADFSATNACFGDSTTFTDISTSQSSNIQSWNWDFQSGNSNLQNPNFVFPAYGNTNVTLIVTANNGCIDTTTKPITVHPLPNVQFTANNACIGEAVQFINQSTIPVGSISNYNWDLSNGTSTLENPTSVYSNYGNYSIKLIATSNNGCKDSVTQSIIIHPLPEIAFTAAPLQGCAPLLVTFTNNSSIVSGNIDTYLWGFGDGDGSNNTNPLHVYNNPGTYNVTLTATSAFGCDSTLTLNNLITVYPKPLASFTYIPENIDVSNPQVSFYNQSSGANNYIWNFGDGDGSTDKHPLHLYKDTGSYTVQLIAENQYGCLDTAQRPLLVKATFTIYIPNTFTPNRDGLNDFFRIYGIGIVKADVLIFDRWGELIYEMGEDIALQKGWNGYYKSKRAKQDIYIYKVSVVDLHGKVHSFMGNINLIR